MTTATGGESHRQTEHLRQLRFAEPLTVVLDGRKGRAVIARPGVVAGTEVR